MYHTYSSTKYPYDQQTSAYCVRVSTSSCVLRMSTHKLCVPRMSTQDKSNNIGRKKNICLNDGGCSVAVINRKIRARWHFACCRCIGCDGILRPVQTEKNKTQNQRTDFEVSGENEDGVRRRIHVRKTSQRSRWSTSTDASSSCGIGGAQP